MDFFFSSSRVPSPVKLIIQGLFVFMQETIYHVYTEIRQSLGIKGLSEENHVIMVIQPTLPSFGWTLKKSECCYRKFPKYSDTPKICCNHSKIWTMWLYHGVMSPNEADGMANSVDPDQTAPPGAVWSGSALFAQTCLSENLGSLR